MKNFQKFLPLFLLILCTCRCFSESDERQLSVDDSDFVVVSENIGNDFLSLVNSGNNAYMAGFISLAKDFFSRAVNMDGIANDQRAIALSGLVEACLAGGDFSEVIGKFDIIQKVMAGEINPKRHNKFFIDCAIVACFKNDFTVANRALLRCDVKTMEDMEIAWHYAVRAVLSAASGNFEEMVSNVEEAERHSASTDQLAQVQAFPIQFMMRMPAKSTEFHNLLATLNSLCKKYRLQKVGYPFVRAYALLLMRSGDSQAANDLIDEQMLAVSEEDVQNFQSFRLHKAIVDGLHSASGYAIVSELLLSSAGDELKKQALKLLISSAENKNQCMDAFKMLSNQNLQNLTKSMVRHVLFTKERLAMDGGDIVSAQRVAEEIVAQFPKEPFIKGMYEALAYLAWQQDPKDYRMAAHYFGKMRDMAQDEREKVFLALRIGDAFYLSDAYDIAAKVYEEVLRSDGYEIQYDKLLCQLIQSDIKSNNLAAAGEHLQTFRQRHNSMTEYRWHGELLYINALIHGGEHNRAMDYLSLLLDTYSQNIHSFYLVKFYLLQAHSLFAKQNYQRAHIVASRICEIFPNKSSSSEIAEIVSKALFIKGTCELKLKNEKDGMQTFQRLHEIFPDLEATALSYFEEAAYLFQSGNAEGGCKVLLAYAERNTKYSPFAYYKCAEYYKSLGAHGYGDAIECLSTLVTKYGNSEIVYAARLEIADLFRLSGRFSDAELVYEELFKDFPFDRRYHFTEFCLAKSIFAQKAKGSAFVGRAKVILERLYAVVISDVSLHIEIAAAYCLVLSEDCQFDEMKKVAWETLLAHISDENELSSNDIYWLLQIGNILGGRLNVDNDSVGIGALRKITDRLAAMTGGNN
jgi:tetratricopeptide (TPR) repeat protein